MIGGDPAILEEDVSLQRAALAELVVDRPGRDPRALDGTAIIVAPWRTPTVASVRPSTKMSVAIGALVIMSLWPFSTHSPALSRALVIAP